MDNREFLKIPDKKGDFSIVVKKYIYEREDYNENNSLDRMLGKYEVYYFQPCFRLNCNNNKIIRKDILWEEQSVLGNKSKGFALADEEDFKNYCRKKFNEFKETLYINPFSKEKEPEYIDKRICSLEFNF